LDLLLVLVLRINVIVEIVVVRIARVVVVDVSNVFRSSRKLAREFLRVKTEDVKECDG